MAPVEPARAAAVAVAATAGVILVALAVAKFKSNNKKHSSEKTDGPETEQRTTPQRKVIVPGSQIPTDGAIQQSNGVSQTEVKVTQNGKSNGSTVKSSATEEAPPAKKKSSPEPAVERKTVPKPAPRSAKTSRKGKADSQQNKANSNLEAKPCLETEIKADSSDSPLLVKQVYKPDDEQGEQTLVSFAEIRFSPRSSPEKSSPSASAGSKTVSVVQKGAHSQEKGEATSPRGSLNSSTNSSFESSSRAVDGAGESLAQIPQTADDSAIGDISGSFPSDASEDASFVLLDVATAPSNCKPDKDIVESAELDRSELSKSVSLQRLKSSGSDSGVGETTPAPDSPDAVDSDPYPGLSDEDIRETLSLAAGRPESLEMRHALTLVKMLSTRDVELQEKLLSVISKVAAFSKSQNNLRQAGCIPRLIHLLRIQRQALAGGVLPPLDFTNALINAVTNLAVNTTNNSLMQECVPPLSDLTLSSGVPDSVRMSSLQALTNLSVTTDHHGHMTRLVQPLYSLVDSPVPSIQLQALKVLVNLSCNKDMVPNLLASKPPNCLLFLLEPKASESLVLRWTTVLGNIMHTVRERQMSSSQLPPVDKAASPETMYSALYGLNSSGHLRNKVFVLSRHPNEDIRYQAARIYSGLTKHSTV